jgi:hypothetical protein
MPLMFGLAAAALLGACAPAPAPAPAAKRGESEPPALAAPAPGILASHEPMYPGNSEAVTLRAVSSASRIILQYEPFSVQPDGTINSTPTGPTVKSAECVSPAPGTPFTCDGPVVAGFPPASFIRFEATAVSASGATSTDSYFFAAGDYPRPDDAIPIRFRTVKTAAALDVVLIPTPDLPAADLRRSLNRVVRDIYLKYDKIREGRGAYNFYYSQRPGRYSHNNQNDCSAFTNPSNMSALQTLDAIVFLHKAEMQDLRCGNLIASEVSNEKSLIHETGHVLFDLRDEYCCGSSYQEDACMPNLWETESGCRAAAPGLGFQASDCTKLSEAGETLDFWRIDPAQPTAACIMGAGMRQANSNFGAACVRRIEWRYKKCLKGVCVTTPTCP